MRPPLFLDWLAGVSILPSTHQLTRLLANHRLVLLLKPDGGLRPILVSCLPRKLIHGAATQMLAKDLQPLLSQVQYGSGRSNGAAALYADLMDAQLHAAPSELVFAKLDISNAFGHAPRGQVLQQLFMHISPHGCEWYVWIHEMLATPMRIPFKMEHVEPFMIWDGLPQGDSLSSLLFCSYISFVLMGSLKKLDFSLVPRAFVDDSLLVRSAAEMARCLPEVISLLGEAGLPVNSAKPALWSPDPSSIADMPDLASYHHAHDSFIICGLPFAAIADDTLPFGSSEFVRGWLQDMLHGEQLECRKLMALHNTQVGEFGLQTSWQFFRTLYPSRILHILRSLPCEDTASFVEGLHQMLVEFVLKCLQYQKLSALQLRVAHLPLSRGGIALPCLAVVALVARISSLACLAVTASATPLVQQWLNVEYPCLKAKLQPFVASDLDSLLGSLQPLPQDMRVSFVSKRLMRLYQSLAHNELKQKLPNAHPLLEWKWRQHGGGETECPQPLAGAWLTSLPTNAQRSLPNDCFRWALRQWLAIPSPCSAGICKSIASPTGLICATMLDQWEHHSMVCSQGERLRRHNQVRDAIAAYARSANIHALIEQRTSQNIMNSQDEHGRARPIHTAVLHLMSPSGAQTWIDVRINHRDTPSQLLVCAKHKLREYGLQYGTSHSLHDRLVPCILDCFGLLHRDAFDVLHYLYTTKVTHMVGTMGTSPAVASMVLR